MGRPSSGWMEIQLRRAFSRAGCSTRTPSWKKRPSRSRTMVLSREVPGGGAKRKNSGWSPGFIGSVAILPEQLDGARETVGRIGVVAGADLGADQPVPVEAPVEGQGAAGGGARLRRAAAAGALVAGEGGDGVVDLVDE